MPLRSPPFLIAAWEEVPSPSDLADAKNVTDAMNAVGEAAKSDADQAATRVAVPVVDQALDSDVVQAVACLEFMGVCRP